MILELGIALLATLVAGMWMGDLPPEKPSITKSELRQRQEYSVTEIIERMTAGMAKNNTEINSRFAERHRCPLYGTGSSAGTCLALDEACRQPNKVHCTNGESTCPVYQLVKSAKNG